MLYHFQVYSKAVQLYIYLYIYIHIYILFQIIFLYKLLQGIKHSSLCYIVGRCCLPILYRVLCICQSQTPNFSSSACYPGFPGWH